MNFVSKTIFAASALALFSGAAAAQDKHFDGPYVGADIALTDGGEFYFGALAGIRTQTDNGFVYGAEATLGDYAVSDTIGAFNASIDYTWSIGGYAGYVFGESDRNLVKLGAAYNNIHVAVKGQGESAGATADDYRVYLGYEYAYEGNWRLRFDVNFLEIQGSNGGQANIGVAYQF